MIGNETTMWGALNRDAIASLLAGDPPLLEECPDLHSQLQSNGFDVTVRAVASFTLAAGAGAIGVSDDDRALPEPSRLRFGPDGWLDLGAGHYLVTFNEVVNLPRWLMALGRPRSSLLRMGVSLHTAVWDAGYSGRSQALLVVHNPAGFRLQRDARIAQLVFFPLNEPDDRGYDGRYQRENL
ncbi:MAG: deoxyuridine 5'-triphosphate nucleotidohydrolase [Chloroflexota bacterium]|nr:deoxyuridine 5'-triphosphate nucleotidohydrolase [Chloroflexota bacterium]MDE2960576.1 deoxyuridine 5'-triphosphate nucleotidohydrolase [Chloroflexota bacterium]